MSALELFKHAGIEDYIKPGLMGAGIGAAGMGLASMFGGEDDESPEQKRSRILGNILKGTALGGAAGAGYQAVKSNFFSPDSGLSPQVKSLQDQLFQRKGQQLDTRPFGEAHPIQQQLVNATHQSPVTDAALGAGVGAGLTTHRNFSASRLWDKLNEGGKDGGKEKGKAGKTNVTAQQMANDKFTGIGGKTALPAHLKTRIMEKLMASSEGKVQPQRMMNAMQMHGKQNYAQDIANMERSARGGFQASQGRLPSWLGGAQEPAWSTAARQKLVNGAGQTMGPFALNSIGRYGKSMGIGAGVGMAAGAAGRLGVDAMIGAQYPREQLQAWNQM